MSFETLLIAGTVFKAVGAVTKGESQAVASEYNAAIARQNAEIARAQGAAAVAAQQREAARSMGRAIAAYGASGVQVDAGSPLDVLADAAANAELDKLTIQYNAELKARGRGQQAALEAMGATTARTSGLLNAGAAILDGAAEYRSTTGRSIPIFGSG